MSKEPKKQVLTIIGAGPAGLTTGIYAARAGLSPLIFEKGVVGGLPTTTHKIENYPGFPEAPSGTEIMKKVREQAEKLGCQIKNEGIKEILTKDDFFIIKTNKRKYKTEYIIIASGTEYVKPKIKGVKEFSGKGVSYCAICDGPFFKNANVAVIGCGNSGLQEGQFLLELANKVHFIEFLPEMTGEEIHQQRVKDHPKSEIHLFTELISINGEQKVQSVTVKDRKTGTKRNIKVEAVFIFVGLKPNTDFLPKEIKTNKKGFIITDNSMATSVKNIFAAGDVREKEVRQIITAMSDGAIAVKNIYSSIQQK